MSAHKGLLWVALLAALLSVILGVFLADLSYASQVCSGDIVSTELCEPARLGKTIFGSLVTASGIVAMSVIVAAFLLGRTSRAEG